MDRARPTSLVVLAALATLLPAAASAAPGAIVDRMTGTQFVERPTVAGTSFQCLGVGGRKVMGFKVYSVAFCLDGEHAAQTLRTALEPHQGLSGKQLQDKLKRDHSFFQTLLEAPGEKMAVVRFARDVSRKQLVDAFRSVLGDHLTPGDEERFLAAIDTDFKAHDVAIMRTQGDSFVMETGPRKAVLSDAMAINRNLWGMWLGADSCAPKLKEAIAARAANLPASDQLASAE